MKNRKLLYVVLVYLICCLFLFISPQNKTIVTAIVGACLAFSILTLKHDLIFILPILVFFPIQNMTGLPLFSIILLFGSLVYFIKYGAPKLDIQIYMFMFMLFWVFFTSLWGEDHYLIIRYIEFYIIGTLVVLLFSSLRDDENNAHKMLYSVWLCAISSLLFKVAFVLNADNLIPYFISIGGNELWMDRLSIYSSGDFNSRFLFFGQEPNYTALSCTVGLFVSLSLWKYYEKQASKSMNVVLIIAIVLNYIQIVGTYSRTGFAVATLMLILLISTNFKVLLFSVVGFVVSVGYVTINLPGLTERITSISDSNGASGRTELWSSAIEIWAGSPIFGAGFSDYYYIIKDAAHNTFLQVLAEQGIVGFIFLITFMISHMIYRNKWSDINALYYGGVGVLSVSIFLMFLSLHDIKVLTFYLGLISLVVSIHINKRSQ